MGSTRKSAVADPGFPVGGGWDLVGGGRGPPRWLHFENFACQNERIWTRGGGGRAGRAPLDPPMIRIYSNLKLNSIFLNCTLKIVFKICSSDLQRQENWLVCFKTILACAMVEMNISKFYSGGQWTWSLHRSLICSFIMGSWLILLCFKLL